MSLAAVRRLTPRGPPMSQAMQFVWLLRADIRRDRPIEDFEAQRDFTAWWLLWGPKEYPQVSR
jgi:hypothetical protein